MGTRQTPCDLLHLWKRYEASARGALPGPGAPGQMGGGGGGALPRPREPHGVQRQVRGGARAGEGARQISQCYSPSQGQEGGGAEGVRRGLVAAAALPVRSGAAGEGVRLGVGEDEGGGVGARARGAGHHRGAERLQLTAGPGAQRLPVRRVEGGGSRQVHVRHGARGLPWPRREKQLVEGLSLELQPATAGLLRLHGRRCLSHQRQGEGRLLGHRGTGSAQVQRRGSRQLLREAQLLGHLAGGPVGCQDELQFLLLLQQVSDLCLQRRLLLLQLVGLLQSKWGCQPGPASTPAGVPPLATLPPSSWLSSPASRAALTACSVSVSSRRRLRHLAAAILFLSRRILLFSSSSGDSCGQREAAQSRRQPSASWPRQPAGLAPPSTSPPVTPLPAHLLDFAPAADALPTATRRLQHCGAGVGGGGGRRHAVGVPAALGGGHGGDEGGLHEPLQVGAGGDGRHRGHKAGARDGQVGAEVLRGRGSGGLPSAGHPDRSTPPPGPRRPRRRAASAGSTRERPVINISDVCADADAAPESPQ